MKIAEDGYVTGRDSAGARLDRVRVTVGAVLPDGTVKVSPVGFAGWVTLPPGAVEAWEPAEGGAP